jgi:Protein of unknown function (DUF1579)
MTDPSTQPTEAHQFDFWFGEWDCTWGEDNHATNHISTILNGWVIQEQFDGQPATPLKGLSLSVYNPRVKCWQQTWVDDSGSYWAFVGGFSEGKMTLATDDLDQTGKPMKRRMIWYNIQPNDFDWSWEKSEDGGGTWLPQWQLHYHRLK